jgi:hypothetical protein
MFKFLKERKQKKERENKKRFVRRNINGEMVLLGEYDRFHRPTRALEDIEAEKDEKKRKEAEEKAKICRYFNLPISICDDNYDNYKNLKGLYTIDKHSKNPIKSDIFKQYNKEDWRYIFRFRFYETEDGEPFVHSKYFPKLVEFFKKFGLGSGCAHNPFYSGDKAYNHPENNEKFVQVHDTGDFADVARCVYTVLSVNKAFHKNGEALYLSPDIFFDILPTVYISAKMKTNENKHLSRALWEELYTATGAEEIFYAQYRAYVGEDADREFWDKH